MWRSYECLAAPSGVALSPDGRIIYVAETMQATDQCPTRHRSLNVSRPGAALSSVAMVAGEASGDLLAALLLQAVHQRWAGVPAFGIGGPRMAEQGFEAWWPHHKLAVH